MPGSGPTAAEQKLGRSSSGISAARGPIVRAVIGATMSRALALTAESPSLRRAQLSFAFIWTAEWAVMVSAGCCRIPRWWPSGGRRRDGAPHAPGRVLTPFAAVVADAVRRERVLACVSAIRAATLAAAAAVLAVDGPVAIVYSLMVLATVAHTLYRPAHSALLPALCAGTHELTSANTVRGLLDSLATLVGPLIAALGLAISGPAIAFAACAVCSLWAGLLVVRLRV